MFAVLPEHLRDMSLFAVNTGCRDQEVCKMRWEWGNNIKEFGTIFIIPGKFTKNGEYRVVVLNKIAKAIVDKQRGKDSKYVFLYNNKPITRMLNKGWINARNRARLPQIRVDDLKHTFGKRLRAAEVSFEDKQDLLGHKSSSITTHYSIAEFTNLLAAANKVCEERGQSLTLLKVAT